MEHCKTCYFWALARPGVEDDEPFNGKRDDHERDGSFWGLRELQVRDENHEPASPQPFEVRYCRSPKMRQYERPEHDGAATIDGSQWFSALVTGEDFGCVNHTPVT